MSDSGSKLPPADLSSSFGSPTSRAAGLGGRLRRTGGANEDPAVAKKASKGSQGGRKSADPEPAPAKAPATRPRPQGEEVLRQVTVYVEPGLRDQVRAERQRELSQQKPRTNASVVLDAVEQTVVDDVLERLSQEGNVGAAAGLFHHRDRQMRPVGAQLPMRISDHDRSVLDELAERYCGGNRSRLVELALRHRYKPS